jgi:hypothetical protein
VRRATLAAVVTLAVVLSLGLLPAAAGASPPQTTFNYGDVPLSGGFQSGHFPEIWDLTAGDMTISFTYDANGLIDDFGDDAHAWAELGVREVGYADFNPTGAGVWLATDYHWAANTFDPDPVGSPSLDMDDKLILQKVGGHGEGDYNLPSAPPNPGDNHRVWFDRDGVDQWQAQNPLAVDGGTYNTGGTYDVVITLHADSPTSGKAYMTINGLNQGFETDGNWKTMELTPAGMTFTGNMAFMQVFYGLYGYGATHSMAFKGITVTGYLDLVPPVVSNVVADPNPVAVNAEVTLTATVDDTETGGSNIVSAEYKLDDGTWTSMDPEGGAFDSPIEDVTASFSAPAEAGLYDLCVQGTDVYGNTSEPECILLVVYDPAGGFVTGGGWIDSPPEAYMPTGAVVVTEANVDVDWFTNDTRYDGYVDFVEGPGDPPLGIGSLEMGTTKGEDKAQLFNYDHMGTLLADIESITYATYRDSGSTNSAAQYPAINMEVDYVGDGSSYTTLVWEPIYAYGQSNLAVDTWQTWDTMAPSQTGWGGGWWSTKNIPGVCAFNCFVDWDTIVTNNPNAKIKYGFGVNIGSGWNGVFTGAVDALSITVDETTTTYDFEQTAPPTGKATFGFVSKYKKGADVPTGQTEFVFKAAGLNFHSSSYDWLVIADDTAKFKGWGTINGTGCYRFMLWAQDGDPDAFRIKIWTEEDDVETVIYDNGMNQPIGGGQIVVHKK